MTIVADGGVAAARSVRVISVGMGVCALHVSPPNYGEIQAL